MLDKLFSEDCYMLDIESTGLSPINNGMTSFALVKFDLNMPNVYAAVQEKMQFRINSSINIDMARCTNADTMQFRAEHGISKAESSLPAIHSLQEIPENINGFVEHSCLLRDTKKCHIFALHTEFDIAFLRGYFEKAHWDFTFPHRNIWEISSLIKGMNLDFKEIRDEIEDLNLMATIAENAQIENFKLHNALYDCVRQIAFLHSATRKAGIIK